ncbi:MAG: hypothetical protein NZ959_00405 [Armatimonadetes bacterium]|nr:hypothetical protein [Armatimonadota bacterium]MDW8120775.1 hypothetical protein [Armatimonadota bacterium]
MFLKQYFASLPKWCFFAFASLVWSWTIYLYGFFVKPSGTYFVWMTQDHILDIQFYLSLAAQQAEGRWFFYDLFTTEPHRPVFFSLHHWLVGFVSAHTGISLTASYHLFRSLGIVAFHWTGWQLGQHFLARNEVSLFLFLVSFTCGLLGVWHLMPELFTPMAFLATSWFVWGLTLTMGLLISLMKAYQSPQFFLLAAILGCLLVITDPSPFPAFALTSFLWAFLGLRGNWQERLFVILPLIPAGVLLFVLGLKVIADPVGKWVANPPLQPPPIWHVLVAHGLLILAGLPEIPAAWQNERRFRFIILWILSAFLLVYLNPFLRPRRLFEGVHIALALLATRGWYRNIRPKSLLLQRSPRLISSVLIFFLVSGTAYYSLWQLEQFLLNNQLVTSRKALTLYLSPSEISTLNWLKEQKEPGAVLCSYQLGAYIPAWTLRRVFVGHWSGTIDAKKKIKILQDVLQGRLTIDEAKKLFQDHNIRFALSTRYERIEARGIPKLSKYGTEVFRSGSNAIYRLEW